jgi:release factor glutamine methyltransferase
MLGMSVAAVRRALADMFRQCGLDSPALDARLLVGHALDLDHTELAAAAEQILDARQADTITALARRRLAREPVARIVGAKEFWGLRFQISPATLVPRPETESVVQCALAAVDAAGGRLRPLHIADLGTGSGAILLALLAELPNAIGVGTDRSQAALEVARENALRLGLSARTSMVFCDFGTALAGGFDLVVSNPPYIATGDIAALSPEVRHDPAPALDGGQDGLSAYRAIAADASRLLKPSGRLLLELGDGQASAVAELLRAADLVPTSPAYDLGGILRVVSAGVATMTRSPRLLGVSVDAPRNRLD